MTGWEQSCLGRREQQHSLSSRAEDIPVEAPCRSPSKQDSERAMFALYVASDQLPDLGEVER